MDICGEIERRATKDGLVVMGAEEHCVALLIDPSKRNSEGKVAFCPIIKPDGPSSDEDESSILNRRYDAAVRSIRALQASVAA